jgi:hypothetical protein
MKSYFIVEFDHNTDQFKVDKELQEYVMELGNCFTETDSQLSDLEEHGVKVQHGWHWSDDDSVTQEVHDFAYDVLVAMLRAISNPALINTREIMEIQK